MKVILIKPNRECSIIDHSEYAHPGNRLETLELNALKPIQFFITWREWFGFDTWGDGDIEHNPLAAKIAYMLKCDRFEYNLPYIQYHGDVMISVIDCKTLQSDMTPALWKKIQDYMKPANYVRNKRTGIMKNIEYLANPKNRTTWNTDQTLQLQERHNTNNFVVSPLNPKCPGCGKVCEIVGKYPPHVVWDCYCN